MKRFAVILGASGEIGETIARQLADSGWSLYLHWNSKPLNELVEEMKIKHPDQEFVPVKADFAKSGSAEELAEHIFDASCIVVASGHALYKMLIDTTEADFEKLWQVHMKNPVSAIRLISPFFHRHPKSYVVFISSIWGEIGASMETAYSAVKGAQLSFVKAYAKEMASAGTRVNAISPGFIATKMNQTWSQEELRAIEEEIPLGLGTSRHVADAVDFLVNGKADYITGQNLRVNGGWHM